MRALLPILFLVLAGTTAARAEMVPVVSTSSNQYSSYPGGTTHVVQHGTYCIAEEVQPATQTFLPATAGLDAVDLLLGGDVLFSTESNRHVSQPGGGIYLKQQSVYRLDKSTGIMSLFVDLGPSSLNLPDLDALDWTLDGRLAFSTKTSRTIVHTGGSTLVRPQSAYLFDPAAGTVELLLDGTSLGLRDLDAVHVLDNRRVAFSTATNTWISGPGGGEYLQHENVYVAEETGCELLFDGGAGDLDDLDAVTMETPGILAGDTAWWFGPMALAEGFDVVRGNLSTLLGSRGDFSLSTVDCVASEQEQAWLSYGPDPAPGEGTWLLMRPVTPAGRGSYDSGGSGQSAARGAGIEASGVACP